MLLLYVILIWQIQAVPKYQLNMYNTDNYQNGYCLIYNVPESVNLDNDYLTLASTQQKISFCFRLSDEKNSVIDFNYNNTNDPSFTFAELQEQNITSAMLLSWSASIDLAERYQIFLNNCSKLISEEETLFYNCTLSWFGPFCRFTFDYEPDLDFELLVYYLFNKGLSRGNVPVVTCYEHLHCQTKLSCLDWREICDGKYDCLDGSDENNCWQLEVNECMDDNYRCHNGQCIPVEFLRDGLLNPDCLDRTDEGRETYSFIECVFSVAFHCEEHKCRLGQDDDFPCGNGQCRDELYGCSNGRTGRLSNDFCSNATACFMKIYDVVEAKWCEKFCTAITCIKDNCPILYEVHFIPLLFGHVRFLYSNKNVIPGRFSLPDYVCYNKTLCIDFLPPTVLFNNLTCRHFNDSGLTDTNLYKDVYTLVAHVKDQFRKCLIATNYIYYCNYSTMYQCENSSKCISKQRILDGIRDCPFDDDEKFSHSCSLTDIHQRFNCSSDGDEKCFASLVIYDRKKDCKYGEDETSVLPEIRQKHISFQTICDGRTDLLPVLIDGRNETDETQCHYWSCNNTYSRCDKFWLCQDGADEINCPSSPCPALHHECVFLNDTFRVSCLPINRANNSITDCLGATDERKQYQIFGQSMIRYYFSCWNSTKYIDVNLLCDKITDCPFNDDEIFCENFGPFLRRLCYTYPNAKYAVQRFLCDFGNIHLNKETSTFFKLYNFPNYPFQITTKPVSPVPPISITARSMQNNAIINVGSFNKWFCNRGVPIRTRVNSTTSVLSCLCPSSYYGDMCQYQNQRVSLTIQIRVTSHWRSFYTFLITLIDNERNIQSYDQVEYLPIRDCRNKFNLYLLYATRPKNSSMNYSVQIDAYNQSSMDYRASWIFPLQFPFLPVHRLSVLLRVPTSNMEPIRKCWPSCIHGKCFQYANDKKSSFCHCDSGWSGSRCHKKHTCLCASDSLCVNNSICLCPYGRFGSRCHLFQLSCRSELCMNGGQCVSISVRTIYKNTIKLMCVCPEEYVGDRCQYRLKRTEIDISFHHKLPIPSSLLIHFIAVHNNKKPNRTSIMKKIAFDQYLLTVYTSVWFNIAFAQMLDNYYLLILQEQMIAFAQISTQLIPSHRCQSLRELFNDSFANQHLLKRIKYYHIPCREQHNLVCFYDDVHFCLCTLDRHTDCFEFDHNMTYDCREYNYCENEGHCFQDNPKCPTSLTCGCRQCYFGSRCQFSTKGSILSLDTILGYHLKSSIHIPQQPVIVKVSIGIITLMFAFGFMNSFLSFQTFRERKARDVGCGIYLFASTILSMIIIVILTLKFSFFLASQIGSLSNRLLLLTQCVSLDFLLRFLVSTVDWLSTCVSIERTVSVLKGMNFNKSKSKQVAKWVILVVVLFTSCTYIYDPIYRRVIDDEEEQRTWCVSQYPSSVQIFDGLLNIFHFTVPFSINCISALIIIITVTRTRSNCHKTKSYKEHLREQFQCHKHLLISPSILVMLAIPRLIISFLSGCMKSARDAWFYLIGYFISFIPSMMSFVIFVLPSSMYKKIFDQSMERLWRR